MYDRYPPYAISTAMRAIESAKADGYISDHGYGEPVDGEWCEYCTDKPVTDATFNISEVATALLYLHAGPIEILERVSRKLPHTSYGLKHKAENWGKLVGFAPYVSNGAFIVAAEWLHVPSRRHSGSPNIDYGVKLLRDVDRDAFESPVMTARAAGIPWLSFIEQGWTNAQLIEHGYMKKFPISFWDEVLTP
jgi:hypothetical protein